MTRSWGRLSRRPVWALALWLSMAITVAALAGLPLVGAMASESALAQTLAGQAALTVEQPNVTSPDAFNGFKRDVGVRVTARMGSDLSPLTDFAAAGPLLVSSLNNVARSAPGSLRLIPTFMDHLGSHVQVLAGQLPAEGLGGDDVAVTMPQGGADQVGLHLSDRFCLSSLAGSSAQPAWCGRIVGLWRPLDPRDPFWGGAVPRLQLMASRYDFFVNLLGTPPRPGTVAGVRYVPNRDLIGSQRTADVSRRLGLLRRDLAASPNLRVGSSLGQTLDAFRQQQQAAAGAIDRVALSIGLLALTVVALIFHHLLGSQARSRAELLRQGRSPAWIWSLSLVELAGLAAMGTLAGLAGAVLVGAAVAVSGSGLDAHWLRASDLGGITAFAVGGIGGIVLIPAELAALAVAVSRESEPPPGRQEQGRLARWRPSALARLLAVGGLLTLPRKLRGEISGTLARSQLEQRPQQHAGVALMLAVATALSVVFAVELVTGPVSGAPGRQPSALRAGPEVSLILSLPTALALALLGWGIHFRSTAEHRQEEYATLFASALPPATIADSVGAEQTAVLRLSLVVGTVLGIAILAALGASALTGPGLGLGVLSVAIVLACILAGTVAVSRMARRLPPAHTRRSALEPPAR